MSIFRAHIFKRAVIGDREEVDIKLFDANEEPINISEGAEGTMVFRGAWSALELYKKYDVVAYNGGSYIFNEDVDPNAAPTISGIPITKLKEGAWPQFQLTVNADSPRAPALSNVAGVVPFDGFAFRLSNSGYLDLVLQPAAGGSRDLYGKLFKLNGSAWDLVSNHDDESSNGHPGVYKSDATAGTYLFTLTTKGGDTPAAYGVSNVFRGGAASQATYAPFVDFPSTKVTQLG